MKSPFYKVWSSVLAVWMLCNINHVSSAVILPPRNTLMVSGTNASMSCGVSSGSPTDVAWNLLKTGYAPLNIGCKTNRSPWTVTCNPTTNYLTVDQDTRSTSSVTTLEVIYCTDASVGGPYSAASFIPLTSFPVCSGPTTPPVRGTSVTLTCNIGFTPGVISDTNEPPRQVQTSLNMAWQNLDGTPVNGLVTSDATSSQLTVVATGLTFPSYVCVSTINMNTISAKPIPNFDYSPATTLCTTKEIAIA